MSLEDTANPVVVSIAPSGDAPEGIAIFKTPEGSSFVYAANEGDGVVTVYEIVVF